MDDEDAYWFNTTTGSVEHGRVSPSVDRIGPFATAEEASHAWEIVRKRARAWAEEERRESE